MLPVGKAGDMASGVDAGAAGKPLQRGTGAIELFKDRVSRQARGLGQRGRRMPWAKNAPEGGRPGKPPLQVQGSHRRSIIAQVTEGAEESQGREEGGRDPDIRRSRAYVGLADATGQAVDLAAREDSGLLASAAAAPKAAYHGRTRAGSAPKTASGFAARDGRQAAAQSAEADHSSHRNASGAFEAGNSASGSGGAASTYTSAATTRSTAHRDSAPTAPAAAPSPSPAPAPAPTAAPLSPGRSQRRQSIARRDVLGRGEQGKGGATANTSPSSGGLGLLNSRDDQITAVPPPDKAAERTVEMHAQALAEFASQLPATHASAVSYVGSQLRDGWRRLAAAEGKLSEEVQSAKGELDSLQTSVRDLADRADKWDARLRRMADAFEGEQASKERELRDKLGEWMRERIQQRERTTIDMYKGELNRVKKLIQERQRDDDREAWLTATAIKVLRWFLNGLSLAASVIMFVVSLVAEPFLKLVGAPPMQPPQFPTALSAQPRASGSGGRRRRLTGATSPTASPPVAAALASITGGSRTGSTKPTPRPGGEGQGEGALAEEGAT